MSFDPRLVALARLVLLVSSFGVGFGSDPARAESSRPQIAGRPNVALLRAPIDLQSCQTEKGNTRRRALKVLGLIPELHTGHKYSIRMARWYSINSGTDVDSDATVRAEITFRVVTDAGTFPLVLDEADLRYTLACSENQSIAHRPNDYPTILLIPHGSGETDSRLRLAEKLREARRLPFLADTAGSAPAMRPPPPSEDLRMRVWISALMAAGQLAFLSSWPEPVTTSLDDTGNDKGPVTFTLSHTPQSATRISEHQAEAAAVPSPPPNAQTPAATAAPLATAVKATPATAPPSPAATGASSGRKQPLVLVIPEALAIQDIAGLLKETRGRCQDRWLAVPDDPRAYQVDCDEPPPYEVQVGHLKPIRITQTSSIVRMDDLVVDMAVPLSEPWPADRFPDRTGHIGPLPLKEFLKSGALLAEFADLPAGDPRATDCVATVPGELGTALRGLPEPLAAPCRLQPLRIPEAWRQRIGGTAYPLVTGCFGGAPQGGVQENGMNCLGPVARELPVRIEFGPGWSPVELPVGAVAAEALAQRLRPLWPYAPQVVMDDQRQGPAGTLEISGLSYCADTRGDACCGDGTFRLNQDPSSDAPLSLPTMAEAGCRPDQPLPHFAIVEFQQTDPGGVRYRFRRYWTISVVAGRPYRIPSSETVRTYPIRIHGDRLARAGEEARVLLFPSLLACQTANPKDEGLDSFPFRGSILYDHRISLPSFAIVRSAQGVVSECAEGVLDPQAPPAATFTLLPRPPSEPRAH
ncbi:MAG: hypothetical protein HQL37_06260 [Alphaproteobacteria bacterium]|nr:hypothetical protein [Alphaproteobacteria bacterium]